MADYIGCKKPSVSKISAAKLTKKSSIYFGKLDWDVTAQRLHEFLNVTFGENDYGIKKLTVKTGKYNAYRVDANLDIVNVLFNSDNWALL